MSIVRSYVTVSVAIFSATRAPAAPLLSFLSTSLTDIFAFAECPVLLAALPPRSVQRVGLREESPCRSIQGRWDPPTPQETRGFQLCLRRPPSHLEQCGVRRATHPWLLRGTLVEHSPVPGDPPLAPAGRVRAEVEARRHQQNQGAGPGPRLARRTWSSSSTLAHSSWVTRESSTSRPE